MSYMIDEYRYAVASGVWGSFIAETIGLGIVFGVPFAFLAAWAVS